MANLSMNKQKKNYFDQLEKTHQQEITDLLRKLEKEKQMN
jgi:hypothetical protein